MVIALLSNKLCLFIPFHFFFIQIPVIIFLVKIQCKVFENMQVLASNKVTQNKKFPIFSYSASQSYISIGQEAHVYAYLLGPPFSVTMQIFIFPW